jgi:hypothetical protein
VDVDFDENLGVRADHVVRLLEKPMILSGSVAVVALVDVSSMTPDCLL